MIVRDEADMLPEFLEHARGVWDELCVVDTGSTDESARILEEAGARITHQPWNDDFSAARNASVELAGGDWILFLDADERIGEELIHQIREVIADDRCGAATITMVHEQPHGHQRQEKLLRLFVNDPGIRFEHRIHEDVGRTLAEYLDRSGRQMTHLTGRVQHLGYVRQRAAARDKKTRDLTLLQQSVDEDPRDLYAWYKILELARFWSDGELLQTTAKAVSATLDDPLRRSLGSRHYGGEMVALLTAGLYGSDVGGALAYLDGWEDVVGASPGYGLCRGDLLEVAGRLDEADAAFRGCLEASESSQLQNITVRPLMGRCRVAMAGGRLDDARRLVGQALEHNARDPEALLCAVFLARAEGEQAGVDALCSDHRGRHGDTDELEAALGEEAFSRGDWDTALAHFEAAAGQPPSGRVALRLSQAKLAAGDVDGAHELATELMESIPEAGIGALICDILESRASLFELDLDQARADQALKAWVTVLAASGQAELWKTFLENGGGVVGAFPWLPDFVGSLQRE